MRMCPLRARPATPTDYQSLVAALAARKRDLRLSDLEVDELAGMPSGYFGKIVLGDRRGGRKFSFSGFHTHLGGILRALEMTIELHPMHNFGRAKDDDFPYELLGSPGSRKNKILAARGLKGAKRRWLLMTESERLRHMRRMWKARSKAAQHARSTQEPRT